MASSAATTLTLTRFFIVVILLTLLPSITHCIPFVVFHGILDQCSSEVTTNFTENLSEWSNTQGYCIEIGNGVNDSRSMPLENQIEIACEKVKNMSELKQGYNMVGLSQGNMVARGVIEFCDGAPPVKNYISVAGPQAGQASLPECGNATTCAIKENWLKLVVYSDFVQENVAPSNFMKLPTDPEAYRKGCKFLPKLNNEFEKNATYKERFSSLHNLVLIMFDNDTVLVPKETSWFGYYPYGAWEPLLPVQETQLYIEDWIGLRTLDEAGKVKFVNVTGGHLDWNEDMMKEYIVPYLVDEVVTLQSPILTISSTLEQRLPSIRSIPYMGFIRKLGTWGTRSISN